MDEIYGSDGGAEREKAFYGCILGADGVNRC